MKQKIVKIKMNSDRSVDELLELFEVRNISELGSDIIMKFFDDISVKEVMKSCRINKQFSKACEKESMWKRKVSNDYGITKKYLDSWKNTAKFLYKSNMINLRQQWINGKTYGELLEESLKSNDDEFFEDLLKEHGVRMFPVVVYSDFVNDLKTAEEDVFGRYPNFNDNNLDNYGIMLHTDENKLQSNLKAMTREFSVISHVFAELHGLNQELDNDYGLACPMNRRREYIYDKSQMRKIRLLADPILYVMTYSFMDLNDLNRINMFAIYR